MYRIYIELSRFLFKKRRPCRWRDKMDPMSHKQLLAELDRPEIIDFLFYPRKENENIPSPPNMRHLDVVAEDGVRLNTRMHVINPHAPHILFFHGNGEIAQDYDEIGQVFNRFQINFSVFDYRGYGRSHGTPSVSSLFCDAHQIMKALLDWRDENKDQGPVWIMGRSLGSAPAIELAASYPDQVEGLIVESGFAHSLPLLRRLGIDVDGLGVSKESIFSNVEKIKLFSKPTLFIHAEQDQIIPLEHGKALFQASPAAAKKIQMVPHADHNTILLVAGIHYFQWIKSFMTN